MYHSVTPLSLENAWLAVPDRLRTVGWWQLANYATLPTQSEEFISALEQTMLGNGEVELFEITADQGALACVAMCRTPGPLGRWHMLGDEELFEPFDALVRDAAAAQALAERLAAEARPIEFARLPDNSPLIPALRAAMRGRGLMHVGPAMASPYIVLDEGWYDPLLRLSSRRRSDFRRARKRAAEAGAVEFVTHQPTPREFDALYDQAVAVEARSWKLAAGSALAADRAKRAFFRRYLTAASAKGQCRISFMHIGGEAVAMHLAVVWDGRYWLYKIGFDEAYARCSPGNQLMLHTIGEAAQAGLCGYEMMGESESWISDLWTRDEHPRVRVRTYPYSAQGLAALAEDGGQWVQGRVQEKVSSRLLGLARRRTLAA
ncbi:GNAT family N-acetyltransferase [Tsuneonella flava]|uniref:GNAT family N-acetyltransferase n=1 Tax=Tsuneonella flava TaxID=2055955 RepID=A0ABX7KCE0_9SPHN|nr:GNAT family N-acetyltransferase [Tsuneonella flava]QSB45132.1 GNAT family N-acetyltransferase [Tsuneonella flava]